MVIDHFPTLITHENQNRDAGIIWYCALGANPFASKSLLLPGVGVLFSTLIILHAHSVSIWYACVSALLYVNKLFSMCGLCKTHQCMSNASVAFTCTSNRLLVSCLLSFKDF